MVALIHLIVSLPDASQGQTEREGLNTKKEQSEHLYFVYQFRMGFMEF